MFTVVATPADVTVHTNIDVLSSIAHHDVLSPITSSISSVDRSWGVALWSRQTSLRHLGHSVVTCDIYKFPLVTARFVHVRLHNNMPSCSRMLSFSHQLCHLHSSKTVWCFLCVKFGCCWPIWVGGRGGPFTPLNTPITCEYFNQIYACVRVSTVDGRYVRMRVHVGVCARGHTIVDVRMTCMLACVRVWPRGRAGVQACVFDGVCRGMWACGQLSGRAGERTCLN